MKNSSIRDLTRNYCRNVNLRFRMTLPLSSTSSLFNFPSSCFSAGNRAYICTYSRQIITFISLSKPTIKLGLMNRPYAVHYLYEYFHEHRGAGKFNAIVTILKYTYLIVSAIFLLGKDTAKMHFVATAFWEFVAL